MTWNRLSNYATTIANIAGFKTVTYHSTHIVKWDNHNVILNSGGWLTSTTKRKMNQASNQFNLGFTVYQNDFTWYISGDFKYSYDEGKTWMKPSPGKDILFKDGIILER